MECQNCRWFIREDTSEEGIIFTKTKYYCQFNNYYVDEKEYCKAYTDLPEREKSSPNGKCKNCRHFLYGKSKDFGLFFTDTRYYCEYRNEYVKEENYGAGYTHVEKIQSNSDCFLTTACVNYYNKSDDCEELTTLRKFRDDVLLKTEEGKELVHQYYIVAPIIVEKINQSADPSVYYEKIYKEILVCMKLINMKEYDKATNVYHNMVDELYSEFTLNTFKTNK